MNRYVEAADVVHAQDAASRAWREAGQSVWASWSGATARDREAMNDRRRRKQRAAADAYAFARRRYRRAFYPDRNEP